MASAPDVPEIPLDWYYAHYQAVGRARSRYLLLLLIISAYTIGLRLTPAEFVGVTFLGLSDIPKCVVIASAVIVLGVLLLALFGTVQASRAVDIDLLERLGEGVKEKVWRLVDAQPNVADFLEYATFVNGKPGRLRPLSRLVLYPLPVLGVVLWASILWWEGVSAPASACPSWVIWVYRAGGPIMFAVLVATWYFMRRRWELYREWVDE